MKRHLAFFVLALAPLFGKALDLTPEMAFRDLEGMKIPVVLFTETGKKISFQPPANWKVSGSGAALSLYPAEVTDALMQLRVRPFQAPAAEAKEDLQKWCRAQLPPDASEPKVEGEATNLFTLGTLPSREITFSYAAQGRRFTTSVAVVEWSDHERLAVLVTARTADFPATHERAIRSMFTWSAR